MPGHYDLLILGLFDQNDSVLIQTALNLIGDIVRKDHSQYHGNGKHYAQHTVDPDIYHTLAKLPHDQQCRNDI